MAQRGAWTPTKVRERIRVSMLVKRLSDHVDGKQEMSQTQIKAAEILLKKSLPDLSSIELGAKDDKPIPLSFTTTDAEL
jgi:hypothetical protein